MRPVRGALFQCGDGRVHLFAKNQLDSSAFQGLRGHLLFLDAYSGRTLSFVQAVRLCRKFLERVKLKAIAVSRTCSPALARPIHRIRRSP
ncbi:MAG: hypothetical protein JWL62_429 [Hyphomicrobiales bacterium]|nr:hypothetical protein [Hyphomicrobiales bacterium]